MKRCRQTLMFIVFVSFSLYLPSAAFPSEQCIAAFDPSDNTIRIPCFTVGSQEFWVNLKVTATEQLRFEVGSFGKKFLPAWVTEKIRQFQSEPLANPPREIMQYQYKGNVVYFISSPCCDQYNYLYDFDGNIICAPSGGFIGTGDGRCPDFNQESQDASLVWRDMRT
jgi:Domain of unknown function (DUF6970)